MGNLTQLQVAAAAPMPVLQAKLRVGPPNDRFEQEADRVADQVMRVADPQGTGAIDLDGKATRDGIQRLCTGCEEEVRRQTIEEEEEKELQAKRASGATPEIGPSLQDRIAGLRGGGVPLSPSLQAFLEPRFGADFSKVRVHTDAGAGQLARAINARAFTVGQHVVLGTAQYSPGTKEGRRLLAHEMTHVLQQTTSSEGPLQRSPDDEEEKTEEKPAAKFVGCNEEQQGTITAAIQEAEALALRAVRAFEREFPLTYEMRAMSTHFGKLSSDQKSTIVQRYKEIEARLGSKTYTCSSKPKKVKEGKEVVDLCGQAPCPGGKMTLFPDFGKKECPAGPVILHEAAHNAGACGDIDKGKGYPPASAQNNAYSYEYFALDVAGGQQAPPELKRRKPTVPKVKE